MALPDDLVAWSVKRIGQKIGDGECWTMLETALTDCGGKTSTQLMGGKVGPDGDYIWGTLVKDLRRDIVVGDILQFRNFVWEDRTEVKTRQSMICRIGREIPIRAPKQMARRSRAAAF